MYPEEPIKKPVAKAAPATQPAAEVPSTQPVQQVQYVTMEKSLNGVGGWLVFWLAAFSIAGITMIMAFFTAISASSMGASVVNMLIFTPILAIAFVASAVLIAMQKKLAILVTYITLGISALYSIVSSIIAYTSINEVVDTAINSSYYTSSSMTTTSSVTLPLLIGGILVTLVSTGLITLYFNQSKRVKATLIK